MSWWKRTVTLYPKDRSEVETSGSFDIVDAWLVVDDAHGFGVLGERGSGSLSHFGLCSERLIYMGTLGPPVLKQSEERIPRDRTRSVPTTCAWTQFLPSCPVAGMATAFPVIRSKPAIRTVHPF